ncbi:uncharacterized protein LOC119557931 [Drosophila subpulchrella]|uniref:uncharacterized protein LOC119557931 n=1 Tax=Drosophila subpulchrella TaxID=1486046 RepID=UPI0018A190FA|nr:uncharacterized protein LOC119557931 [Drosophila subpulchrella]
MRALNVRRLLYPFVKRTFLAQFMKYYNGNGNIIKQVARNFSIQLRGSAFWDLDTVHPMLAGLCIFILVEHKGTDLERKLRTKLMNRFLNVIECVHPMTVHILVEKLLTDLEESDACQEQNLFILASVLSKCSWRGRPLAVCLLWEILSRRMPALEVTMHRYRELEELVKAVDKLPTRERINWGEDILDEAKQEKLDGLSTLVESVELLIRLIMCDNKELLEAGYPEHFFQISQSNAISLKSWFLEVTEQMPLGYCENSEKLTTIIDNMMSII